MLGFVESLAKVWRRMSIRIYLTGRVAIEVDGKVVVDERRLRGRQGRLLFAYIVCERTRPVSKEELAAVVWPGDLSISWEGALSALVSRLATVLSSSPLKAQGVRLSRGYGQYQLHLPADAWIDIEAGLSALVRAEAALRKGQPGSLLGAATVAATIARRPFLTGVDGYWAESQRSRLSRQLLRALDCLYEQQVARGELALAVETAIEAITLDPYRERAHLQLMRAYDVTGNRAKAVDVYHRLRVLLAEELGTEPSPETGDLYLELLG